MKSVLSRLFLLAFVLGSLTGLTAQDRVPVVFKVFPQDYEVFFGGDRLPYSLRSDGLRVYNLPSGTARVNLAASGSAPLSLTIEVKAGTLVQTKLEPRQGPLSFVGTASTGQWPRNVAFTADGKRLLVALQGEPGVDVFEVPSLKKVSRLEPASPSPSGFTDVLPVGSVIWAVQKDGRVHVFDGTTLAFQETFTAPRPGNTTLADLGGKVAFAHWDDSVLSIVDPKHQVVASLALGGSLRGFAFGSGLAYASLFDRGQVAVIDAATWKVKALWSVGKAPRPVARAGTRLFVGDMGSAQVLVLDETGKIVSRVTVASNPHQMAVSADQSWVAVASRGRNNPDDYQKAGPDFGKVTLLDAQGQVQASVWGRNQPTGLAFSPDGRYLAFTDFLDNGVELYRITR